MQKHKRGGFTLLELLVVIGVLTLLIGILVPSLHGARQQAKRSVCSARLKSLASALHMYANEGEDYLPPGRLPKDSQGNGWVVEVAGGLKYRPTFLALLGTHLTLTPFQQPLTDPTKRDQQSQFGDRQNYSAPDFVCPSAEEWTDERNGAYGYNYQFLGNARIRDDSDLSSFKNWPVAMSRARRASELIVMADSMGTAASFGRHKRLEYENNGTGVDQYGNEGFNLDPPAVDPEKGEMTGKDDSPPARTAVDVRHRDAGNVGWMDGHVTTESPTNLGYQLDEETGAYLNTGSNRLWTLDGSEGSWIDPSL